METRVEAMCANYKFEYCYWGECLIAKVHNFHFITHWLGHSYRRGCLST